MMNGDTMAKKKTVRTTTCSRKYDLPLFCASWTSLQDQDGCNDDGEVDGQRKNASDGKESSDRDGDEEQKKKKKKKNKNKNKKGGGGGGGTAGGFMSGHVILGGGGGMRSSGIPNSLVLARFDQASDSLSEPVHVLSTDDDPPYRMAVHPTGHGIVCSFTTSCKLFELVKSGTLDSEALKLEPASEPLLQLQDVGEQSCLVFSADGTRFATGGDDGHLRVFEWPSLRLILDQADSHKSIKDLDFSLDAAFLASTGGAGPCRIWDLSTGAPVVSLSLDPAGDLGFCRYSRDGTKPLLFLTVKEGAKGGIAMWDTNNWRKVGVKKFQDCPISAFAMSPNGKFLAMGSSEGDVSIVEVGKMAIHRRVKRAHMIFVTSMDFSRNGRALLSVSADSSARVTTIDEEGKRDGRMTILILIFIAILFTLYVAKNVLWNAPETEETFNSGLQVNITD